MHLQLCPHQEPFNIGGEAFSAQEIIETLTPTMLTQRRDRLHQIVDGRTYSVVPVLDGLYDHGNVNAVIRSAEAMGYQALHQIDSSQAFKPAKRVSQGADKWLDIRVWPAPAPCLAQLKQMGYRILVTHLDEARPIQDFAFDTPAAIVFGNEKDGVSDETLEWADARVCIPMDGFSQSFNISVAAALCLYHIREDRIRRCGRHGDLDPAEKACLTASYCLRSVASAESILLQTREKQV